MKQKSKFVLCILSLVMMLSIPLNFWGEGKILADENEKEERLISVIENLEYVYDQNGNFKGIYEEDLEALRGTEYEYIITDLENEGYLLKQNNISLRSTNPHDEARKNAQEAVDTNPEARRALTSCMAENLGPAVGETFIQQVIRAEYVAAVATLGKFGVRATVPGLIGTYVECLTKAQINT